MARQTANAEGKAFAEHMVKTNRGNAEPETLADNKKVASHRAHDDGQGKAKLSRCKPARIRRLCVRHGQRPHQNASNLFEKPRMKPGHPDVKALRHNAPDPQGASFHCGRSPKKGRQIPSRAPSRPFGKLSLQSARRSEFSTVAQPVQAGRRSG